LGAGTLDIFDIMVTNASGLRREEDPRSKVSAVINEDVEIEKITGASYHLSHPLTDQTQNRNTSFELGISSETLRINSSPSTSNLKLGLPPLHPKLECEDCGLICHTRCTEFAPLPCDLRAQLMNYAREASSSSPLGPLPLSATTPLLPLLDWIQIRARDQLRSPHQNLHF